MDSEQRGIAIHYGFVSSEDISGIGIIQCEYQGHIYTPLCLNTSGGNVGIGTTTPNYTLDVNGNLYVKNDIDCSGNLNITGDIDCSGNISSTTFQSSSDYRLKENINDINLDKYSIDNLKPKHFNFKNNKKENFGLIAHEVEEIFPFLVEGDKDGLKYQSVNYISIIGLLIKEIQALKKDVLILKQNKK